MVSQHRSNRRFLGVISIDTILTQTITVFDNVIWLQVRAWPSAYSKSNGKAIQGMQRLM